MYYNIALGGYTMIKICGGYYLNTSSAMLFLSDNKAFLQRGAEMTNISYLEAAQRAIFDYRESEGWVICSPFEKLHPNKDEVMLEEIRNIVGEEIMIQAIKWSDEVKDDYQLDKSNFLVKTLRKNKQ